MGRIVGLSVLIGSLFGCSAPQRPDGGKGLLLEGAQAPAVSGIDQDGRPHQLAETRGSVTVVYFYPKDETPGCTKEACAFRDAWTRYGDAGVKLFAVSKDTQEAHRTFAEKYKLPFPLISDADGVWARAFGVSTRLGMYQRVTFVVGRDGAIAKVYADVNPAVHATEVLAEIEKLGK